tara:strand:+ start:798 stop:1454 length:657 start_codon:yes stop_codon:yes gene_type:complete
MMTSIIPTSDSIKIKIDMDSFINPISTMEQNKIDINQNNNPISTMNPFDDDELWNKVINQNSPRYQIDADMFFINECDVDDEDYKISHGNKNKQSVSQATIDYITGKRSFNNGKTFAHNFEEGDMVLYTSSTSRCNEDSKYKTFFGYVKRTTQNKVVIEPYEINRLMETKFSEYNFEESGSYYSWGQGKKMKDKFVNKSKCTKVYNTISPRKLEEGYP